MPPEPPVESPASLEDAYRLLADDGAAWRPVAGGTDLLVQITGELGPPPDRVLDLHGHSLEGAWSAIDLALERSIQAGDRLLLLITGHERKGDPPLERGRIRAAVHDWLAASPHAARIAAVRGAHRRHGGGGSLYIILRRS